jgi:hypothetical protein
LLWNNNTDSKIGIMANKSGENVRVSGLRGKRTTVAERIEKQVLSCKPKTYDLLIQRIVWIAVDAYNKESNEIKKLDWETSR